jgi:hypothetical protein
VLSSETVKSVIVTLSGRRRCVSAPGGWLAGNAGADLVNLSQPSIPIGIGFKRRQRTTLNILPDPVRLALPVTPPPRRPFDLEYDAASPETVQAARAGACFERKYSSVQYNTIQCSNSNLTRGGAHAHAPLVVGRQPCDRQMTSKLFRPILAVNHLERAGQRSGSTSRPLGSRSRLPFSDPWTSKSFDQRLRFRGSWPVMACGLDMSNLRRKL